MAAAASAAHVWPSAPAGPVSSAASAPAVPAARREKRGALVRLGAHLLMNCLSRPDFVAYDHETDRNFSFRMMRCLFHPPLAAWTVRSEARAAALKGRYDVQIFEGFLPEPPKKENSRHE